MFIAWKMRGLLEVNKSHLEFLIIEVMRLVELLQCLSVVGRLVLLPQSTLEWCRKFLAKPCALVEANTVAIRSLSANVEVGLGFLLIFMVVT